MDERPPDPDGAQAPDGVKWKPLSTTSPAGVRLQPLSQPQSQKLMPMLSSYGTGTAAPMAGAGVRSTASCPFAQVV